MRREERQVYRHAAGCFAFVDFVSSITTWYNAKSTGESAKSVHIKKDGAQQFLTKLEGAVKETFSNDGINKRMEEEVSLTVIRNRDANPKMNHLENSLRLFGVPCAEGDNRD